MTPAFNYIAIEGPIGVGKTSLTHKLAQSLDCDTLLEQPQHNPFLERFYMDRKAYALPTQLHFLFQRVTQLQEIKQRDLFQTRRVADFLIDKDPLFAQTNLDHDELALYQRVFDTLQTELPKPDLVIYLQAPTPVLMERVKKRGIDAEQQITEQYLETLNECYMRFFHDYQDSPLFIVNAEAIDFVNNDQHYQDLLDTLMQVRGGRHYYNPFSQNLL